ncbi:hypothetical protein FCL40_13190 [Ferrimonas sediminicola]|uniref:Uncharacterized protein n=1 Tax=Ferrimonas sediminicola TaxID=2569538 RepID=A0A4U1BEA7_9GAMM|nr:hypothetical protein [Ferrimonas sediminicola]TKB48299.1 hypothetical protein FCL40_13190 [Ferrimonas sediminicola]
MATEKTVNQDIAPHPLEQRLEAAAAKPIRIAVNPGSAAEPDFDALVRDQRVDASALYPLISATRFDAVLDKFDVQGQPSEEVAQFQARIEEFILASEINPLLQDARVACNNDLCLAEFSSLSGPQLQGFVQEFLSGAESPLHPGGTVTRYEREGDGRHCIRLAFNSDPEIVALMMPR